jgi:hypothetical protein
MHADLDRSVDSELESLKFTQHGAFVDATCGVSSFECPLVHALAHDAIVVVTWPLPTLQVLDFPPIFLCSQASSALPGLALGDHRHEV